MPLQYYQYIDNELFAVKSGKPFPALDLSFSALMKKEKNKIFGDEIFCQTIENLYIRATKRQVSKLYECTSCLF